MNMQEITQLMANLGTEYPKNFEVTPERIKLWHKILEDFEYREGEKALIKLLSEARPFPPVVGEICEEIRSERASNFRHQRLLESEAEKRKALPPPEPEISEEKRQENLAILKKLSEDIARKKAMRQ